MANKIGEELVASFDALFGAHDGVRAAHAKGTCAVGTFTASPEAAALSRAPHLQDAPVRATVRFSNGSGNPTARDNGREPRGMSVKFHAPESETDIVAINQSVFIVRTAEAFLEFMTAQVPDPATGKPDLAKLGAFMGAHPEGQRAAEIMMTTAPLESFLRATYHAIHAYRLVNAAGAEQVVRYRWEPDLGESAITRDEARERSTDYLREDLIARLTDGPASFTLHLQLGDEQDDPDDPTVEWPLERADVIAGRLVIEELSHGCDAMVFDPTRTCDGIRLTKDKILAARARAYGVSAKRRLP